ncbi:MAG: flagellar export protein FliJ [Lachnospiraceae bacterium]|nr:flagellar export protein FliJ [Lachnospiraceae bacterium]
MARFRYRMQSILDIKLKMETQAKQEFAAAQQRLNEEEEKLAALRERRAEYERRARQQLLGALNRRDMAENKEALLRMDEYIAMQHIQIRKAEEKVEQAREKLAEVMKERKSHETLKDKAFEQFLMDEKKQEGKEVDELTSYTYGQKQKEKAVVEA